MYASDLGVFAFMKQSLLDMNTQTNTSTVTVGYVTTTKARETLEFNDIEKIDLKKRL